MSRKLALMFSLVMLVALAIPLAVLAGTQGPACAGGDTTKLLLWENTISDTSDNNDNFWRCGSDADLTNNSHTLPGDCKKFPFGSGTWNDCVNSISFWIPAGTKVCLYEDAGYQDWFDSVQGPVSGSRFNIFGDTLTSFLFRPTNQSCFVD